METDVIVVLEPGPGPGPGRGNEVVSEIVGGAINIYHECDNCKQLRQKIS
jgi:hypothetical protein